MILIAYDGSDDARYPAPGALSVAGDTGEIDDASSTAAEEKAEEGAALARAHGLDAGAHCLAREGSIAETLLAEADRIKRNDRRRALDEAAV